MLTDWLHRRWRVPPKDYWDGQRAQLREESKGKEPDADALATTMGRLDSMLAQAIENFDTLDRKAIGVLGGVAAVAAFLAGNLQISRPEVGIAGAITLLLAMLACVSAISVVQATAYSAGAGARELARATSADPLQRDQGIVESLAIAVVRAEHVMEVKANWLNAALVLSVGTILSLAIFAALGGVE